MYRLEVSNGLYNDQIPMVFRDVYQMAETIFSISEHYVQEDDRELVFKVTRYVEEMSQEEFDALVEEAVAEEVAEEVEGNEDEHESV